MKRSTLGRVLILLGLAAWLPYFYLKLTDADPDILPFLIWHLLGVIPGALLAPSETLWARIGRLLKRNGKDRTAS